MKLKVTKTHHRQKNCSTQPPLSMGPLLFKGPRFFLFYKLLLNRIQAVTVWRKQDFFAFTTQMFKNMDKYSRSSKGI